MAKGKLFLIITTILLVVAIPLTVYVAKQQQETRSRAGGGGASLAVQPANLEKIINDTFTVDIVLKPGGFAITGVDITFTLNPAITEFVSFTSRSIFSDELISNYSTTTGDYRYVAVDTTISKITEDIIIGTLTLKAKAVGTGSLIFQDNIQIVGENYTGAIPRDSDIHGTYIVSLPPTNTPIPPTETPTPTPTVIPSPTVAPIPSPTATTIPSPTNTPIPTNVPPTATSIPPTVTLTPTPTATPFPTSMPTGVPTITTIPPTETPTPTTIAIITATNTPPLTQTPQPGDADGDGITTILDFNLWRSAFLELTTDPRADINNDGMINIIDFNVWRNAFLNL